MNSLYKLPVIFKSFYLPILLFFLSHLTQAQDDTVKVKIFLNHPIIENNFYIEKVIDNRIIQSENFVGYKLNSNRFIKCAFEKSFTTSLLDAYNYYAPNDKNKIPVTAVINKFKIDDHIFDSYYNSLVNKSTISSSITFIVNVNQNDYEIGTFEYNFGKDYFHKKITPNTNVSHVIYQSLKYLNAKIKTLSKENIQKELKLFHLNKRSLQRANFLKDKPYGFYVGIEDFVDNKTTTKLPFNYEIKLSPYDESVLFIEAERKYLNLLSDIFCFSDGNIKYYNLQRYLGLPIFMKEDKVGRFITVKGNTPQTIFQMKATQNARIATAVIGGVLIGTIGGTALYINAQKHSEKHFFLDIKEGIFRPLKNKEVTKLIKKSHPDLWKFYNAREKTMIMNYMIIDELNKQFGN